MLRPDGLGPAATSPARSRPWAARRSPAVRSSLRTTSGTRASTSCRSPHSDNYVATIGPAPAFTPTSAPGPGTAGRLASPIRLSGRPDACRRGLRLRRRERPRTVPVPGRRPDRRRPAARRPARMLVSRKLRALRVVQRLPADRRAGRGRGRGLRPAHERAASRGWTSADAAGLPSCPVLSATTRWPPAVRHALRFTVAKRATSSSGRRATASSSSDPAYPPMGRRFRLKAGFDHPPLPGELQVSWWRSSTTA